MTDFRVLLEDLVEEVIDANQYMPPGVQSAIERARAALAEPPLELPTDEELLQIFDAACLSEGGTTDELHLRGLRAVLAADRARRPAPEPPAEGEVGELVDQLAGDQEMKIYRLPDLNGTIDSSKSSVPQPVPVSERLPGPEDCLDEGWAWFFNPRTGWRQATQPVHTGYTHWLPAHALPLPSTEHS